MPRTLARPCAADGLGIGRILPIPRLGAAAPGSAALLPIRWRDLGNCQVRPNEHTKAEFAQAYRSKSDATGTYIPSHEWEHWRTKEISGWKLHFKRISEKRSPGDITLKYEGRRQEEQLVCGLGCADYAITDTMPPTPANPR